MTESQKADALQAIINAQIGTAFRCQTCNSNSRLQDCELCGRTICEGCQWVLVPGWCDVDRPALACDICAWEAEGRGLR